MIFAVFDVWLLTQLDKLQFLSFIWKYVGHDFFHQMIGICL